ncbi:IclR family transcriptional regulator [Senegalia sp. (in: firmicutes)]|uniref:IclR family transcriptional regulator n=1 Tax=Senegalia sp. (in: firmicutes) TaxID=1924098 RepID=UPI003F9D118A
MINNNNLTSIEKAILILKKLSDEPYEYKAQELSDILKINKTTIHRTLNILLENDLVIKDNYSKEYRLGPEVYKLGTVYLNNVNFENKIEEILNEISAKTKESVGLAIRDKGKIVSLYEIELYQPMKMNYRPGIFYPINRGCYGKCLMAYYDQEKVKEILKKENYEKVAKNTLITTEEILKEYEKIRKDGYITSIEESFKYAIGVGIPIFNSKNEVEACLAISFLKTDNYIEKIEEFKKILFEYKPKIEKYIP